MAGLWLFSYIILWLLVLVLILVVLALARELQSLRQNEYPGEDKR